MEKQRDARELVAYLRQQRHPLMGLGLTDYIRNCRGRPILLCGWIALTAELSMPII
jgi:hypothetical protein